MKSNYKALICSMLLLGAAAAHAEQTDITVLADIDPTVALTLADGTALPDSIKLQYRPAAGLEPYKANVKVWSNSTTLPINVKLASPATLTDQVGANPIALSVSLNGNVLSTTDTTYQYAAIFTNGNTNGSAILPFAISQTTPTQTVVSGKYSGVVSIIVTQGTST